MHIDTRKAALITGVLLALIRCLWIFGQMRVWTAASHLRWFYVVQFTADVFFLVPLSVLLFLLYTTGVVPILSDRIRYLAIAAAFLQAFLVVAPEAYALFQAIQRDSASIELVGYATVADKVWAWLRLSEAGALIFRALNVLSQIALLLFFVVLARKQLWTGIADVATALRVSKAAQIAALAGALALIWGIAEQVYAAKSFDNTLLLAMRAHGPSVMRRIMSEIPALCSLLAAWLVYKGVTEPHRAVAVHG